MSHRISLRDTSFWKGGAIAEWAKALLLVAKEMKKFKNPVFSFKAAYKTCRDTYGETHPQSLVLLNSMGTVASVMGKDDQVRAGILGSV